MSPTTTKLLDELIKEGYVYRTANDRYIVRATISHEVVVGAGSQYYIFSDLGNDYYGQPVLAVRPKSFQNGMYHSPFELSIRGDSQSMAVLTALDDTIVQISLNHTEIMALIAEMEGDVFPKPLDTKNLTGVTIVTLNKRGRR